MQDGNYDWLNKLETKIDNITVEFTRTSTEILTKKRQEERMQAIVERIKKVKEAKSERQRNP